MCPDSKQFSNLIGRWGGDEFIVLLDCGFAEATAQTDRLGRWVCGNYTAQAMSGMRKLRVDASIGLAEHKPDEPMKELLDHADAAVHEKKPASRSAGNCRKQ